MTPTGWDGTTAVACPYTHTKRRREIVEKCGKDSGSATGNDNGNVWDMLNGTREVHASKSKAQAYVHTIRLL